MSEGSALIPDPRNSRKYATVQSIPGLSDAERDGFKETLVGLITTHMDVSMTWTHQKKEALRKYTDDALRLLPWLARFENTWPTRTIGQSMLQRRGALRLANIQPAERIPRPKGNGKGWNAFRKMTSIPGLTGAEKALLKKTMPDAAESCLNLTLHWTEQTNEAQKAYFAHMLQHLPFLFRYEDTWPAEACIRPWLANHLRVHRESRTASVEIISAPPLYTCSAVRMASVGAPNSPSACRLSSSPAGVADLLASAYPGMSHELTSLLHRGGVTTVAHLDVIASLPQAERENFIKDDLDSDLTPFQARLLRRFLDGRRDQ